MAWDDVKKVFHYPCPCGDRFEISRKQLKSYEDIATCPSCSLIIRVIYDPVCGRLSSSFACADRICASWTSRTIQTRRKRKRALRSLKSLTLTLMTSWMPLRTFTSPRNVMTQLKKVEALEAVYPYPLARIASSVEELATSSPTTYQSFPHRARYHTTLHSARLQEWSALLHLASGKVLLIAASLSRHRRRVSHVVSR